MTATTNLDITLMADNPSDPVSVLNNAVQILESAFTEDFLWTITTGVTVTKDQLRGGTRHTLGGTPAAAFNFNLPSGVHRRFRVVNSTGKLATIQVTGGTGLKVIVPNGLAVDVHSNGTDVVLVGVLRVILKAVTANTTFVVPAGCGIARIYIEETAGHIVTGGIKIGTTSGGTDVVAAQPVGASSVGFVTDANTLLRIFSMTVDETLFLQAVTAWNTASINVQIMLDLLT